MGFKRTSEGRIFFQAPEDGPEKTPGNQNRNQNRNQNENGFDKPINLTQKAPDSPPQRLTPASDNAPHTQMQIVTLLKTLNERLKLTQAERNKMAKELETYRGMIETLQKKSEASEKAYNELSQKITKTGGTGGHAESLARDALEELEETRKLLHDLETKANRADKGVSVLKKMQDEQAEKISVSVNHAAALTKRLKDSEQRQEQIGARVDDALGQQARLARKIDKAIEERARFTRKLERIEEAVLQTRDSLNAKAMVLLTDQGVAAHADLDEAAAARQGYAPGQFQADPYAAQKAAARGRSEKALQVLGVALFITAALLGLWLFNAYKQQSATVLSSAPQEDVRPTAGFAAPLRPEDRQAPPSADMTAMNWSIETETSAFNGKNENTATGFTAPQIQVEGDDIGTLNLNDQAQVEALLSKNPDAVAATLNKIEPPEALPEEIIPPAGASSPPPEDAPARQAEAPRSEKTAAAVESAPAAPEPPLPALTPQDPAKAAKPDPALPDAVKNIEAEAFEGVAEAQHDLAAIYTAGHGGVKQDYKRAAFWFEQAAARGVANAAYNLGVLNHQGLGTSADLEKAITWYKRAAALGHPEAQYNLGIAYIEGIGVPYDAEKAAGYFTRAAESNIMEAAYNLGLIYENGLLGDAQPDKALLWYKTAADQGSPEAAQALKQLAESLGVSLDKVNGLAESMKTLKKSEAGTPPSAAPAQQVITAQVQEYLMRVGLYPGPADGITGPLTQDAVRSYQRLHNLKADGNTSQDLLSHMLANAIDSENRMALDQGSRAQ
ncbi:MAG: peptidoglycan-binding protein [Alphaproteobacteria bacterium]